MSTIVNLRQRISDVVKHEADNILSRESVVGAVVAAFTEPLQYGVGAVVGLSNVGAITPVIRAGSAGNGTLGTWTAGAGCFPGVWTMLCIEPTTNIGKFELRDPNGLARGIVTVAAAFTGPISGTIADGATDWAAGDVIDVTVAALAAPNVAFYDPASATGAGVPYGVLLIPSDANQVIPIHVVLRRDAMVAAANLVWGTGVTTQAQKDVALAFLEKNQNIISNRAVV